MQPMHRVQAMVRTKTFVTKYVSTAEASSIATSTATTGGTFFLNIPTTITRYGVVYSITDSTPIRGDPGVLSNETNESTSSPFIKNLTTLQANTTYYYCAFVSTGSSGSRVYYYGDVKTFKTLSSVTLSITSYNAVFDGNPHSIAVTNTNYEEHGLLQPARRRQ